MNNKVMKEFINRFVKRIKKENTKMLISLDMDGTIKINQEIKDILDQIGKEYPNVKIILNTGRSINEIRAIMEREKIPIEYFDYIIGDNGGICIDSKNNSEVFRYNISRRNIPSIMREIKSYGLPKENMRFSDGQYIYATKNKCTLERYKDRKKQVRLRKHNIMNKKITKIMFSASKNTILDLASKMQKLGLSCDISEAKYLYEGDTHRIDITEGTNKGIALKRIIQQEKPDICISMGNDTNDIDMFLTTINEQGFIVILKNNDEGINKCIRDKIYEHFRNTKIKIPLEQIIVLNGNNVNRLLSKLVRIFRCIKKTRKKGKLKFNFKLTPSNYRILREENAEPIIKDSI